MDAVQQADDNMKGGITYTFTLLLANWFGQPSIPTILADLDAYAPGFMGSVTASWSAGLGLLTNYLNITFNYTGDGSDVISDVAAELIAALSQGSGDSFTFYQATSGTAGITSISAATALGEAVGTGVGSTVGAAVQGTTTGLVTSAWPILLVAGLGFLAYLVATTGVGRSVRA
jgi:hypothetical protein